jgi:hypothetical protein
VNNTQSITKNGYQFYYIFSVHPDITGYFYAGLGQHV